MTDDIALFCKRKEIEALEKADQFIGTDGFTYWDAKAQAFSQVWEYIVFKGKKVGKGITPQEYNLENERWSREASNSK